MFSIVRNHESIMIIVLADFRDEQCIREIQETVGANGKILVLVSGGVDSSVLAALCFKAVGADRVKCLHIDNGFMRKGAFPKPLLRYYS